MMSGTSINKSKQLSKLNVFDQLTILTGLVLIGFATGIYRETIIGPTIPIFIILAVGLTTFFLTKSHYNRIHEFQRLIIPLMQCIASWGFIAGYLFMAINYYLADNELKEKQFKIESKSSIPGPRGKSRERRPTVTIDYFGFKKELFFSFRDTERVKNASKVNVTIRKGLLGFDILNHYDVVDSEKW